MFEVYGTKFNVDARYSFLKALGKGAYGVVCSTRDAETGNKVAIKKICPMAKTRYDAIHTLREIRLLRYCGAHPNIISLVDLMVNEDLDELYIGMECADTDLHRIIQSSQKLSVSHHKHFMHQLLLGIKFLHDQGILHRDLKPANLLVSKNCDLRISDFGLARRAPNASDGKPLMTEHVVTRWYRAPELMLSPDGKYTAAVDIWSVGCIFAELLGRTPLFPGKNFVHQLQLIFDVIGSPHSSETGYIKNSQAIQFLRSLPKKKPVDLQSIYPHASGDAIDFMQSCLMFSANRRLSVSEALAHPFFANAPLQGKKIVVPPMDPKCSFAFEQEDLTPQQIREIILDEVYDFQVERNIRPVPSRSQSISNQLAEEKQELRSSATSSSKKIIRAMSARASSSASKKVLSSRIARPHSACITSGTGAQQEPMEEDSQERRSAKRREHHASSSLATSSSSTSSSSRKDKTRINHDDDNDERSTERENNPYATDPSGQAVDARQKKKSRSFSRILSSSIKLKSSSRLSTGSSSSTGSTTTLPNVHQKSRRSSVGSSPMSCDSADSPMDMEEHKTEPSSSMLPIKTILKKSTQPLKVNNGWSKSSSSTSTSSSKKVTVPQPFNFSHPRNRSGTTSISSSSTDSLNSARYHQSSSRKKSSLY